jgi:hypothetical protein
VKAIAQHRHRTGETTIDLGLSGKTALVLGAGAVNRVEGGMIAGI